MKARLVGAIGLLLFCNTGLACDLADFNWSGENALDKFLKQRCAREPNENETRLFLWGHQDRINKLKTLSYGLFKYHNDAHQYAYANFRARQDGKGYLDHPDFHNYVAALKGSLGIASVQELYNFSANEEMLDYLEGVLVNINELDFSIKTGTVKHEVTKKALAALALEQINPGYLRDLPYSLAELIKTTEARLDDKTLTKEKRLYLEGRLLGYQRASQKIGTGKPSNISYGPAVYFSHDPALYLSHYYDANHTGISCVIPEGAKIYDIGNVHGYLKQQDVLLSDKAKPEMEVRFPTDYNELASPAQFREAMQGKIIKRGGIYADSGVMNYKVAGQCSAIELSDFSQCNQLAILISYGSFNKG